MAQGKYAEAIIEYSNAVLRNLLSGEARFKLAEAHYAAGDTKSAFPQFVRAADLLKDDVEAQLRAGHLLLSGGLFEEARVRARAALQLQPNNRIALVLMGNTLAGMKNLEDAVSLMQRAIQVDPERAGVHVNLGVLQLARGEHAAAEQAFKRAVDVSRGAPEAQLALANFYRAVKRPADAEALLHAAHETTPQSVAVNQALASLYIETGRIDEAEAYFTTIVAIQKDAPSQLALASYYMSSNRDHDALKTLDALAANPDHVVDAKIHLAMFYFARGRRTEAHRAIDDALAHQPENATALTVKARLLLSEKRTTDALAAVNEALRFDRQLATAHLTLGRIRLAQRQIDDARTAFNDVLRLDPQSIPARLELSDVHLKRNEIDSAIRLANEAVELNGTHIGARLARIRTLLVRPDDREQADTEIQQLLATNPRVAEIHAAMGVLRMRNDDYASARQSFELALKLDPDSLEALSGLTALDISGNRLDQARSRLEAFGARRPNDSAQLLLAANAYGMSGDLPRAEAALRRAMTVDASNPSIYSQLGGLYMRQNRIADSIEEFEEVARLEPRSVGAATLLGLLYYAQGSRTEAEKWWSHAVDVDPYAAAAANNLAWLYAERSENLDTALQLAQTARSVHPEAAEILDTVGWVYYQKGLTRMAQGWFEQCIQKDPKNPLYHYHLGKALAKNGEDGKARRSLQHALELDPNFAEAVDARKTIETLVF
jgi:putative PEP-CTERM system TPR-repeat lipoprotein